MYSAWKRGSSESDPKPASADALDARAVGRAWWRQGSPARAPDQSALTPALACIGFMVGHIAWAQAFDYVDTGDLILQDRPQMVAAVAVLRGLICAAFILDARARRRAFSSRPMIAV